MSHYSNRFNDRQLTYDASVFPIRIDRAPHPYHARAEHDAQLAVRRGQGKPRSLWANILQAIF